MQWDFQTTRTSLCHLSIPKNPNKMLHTKVKGMDRFGLFSSERYCSNIGIGFVLKFPHVMFKCALMMNCLKMGISLSLSVKRIKTVANWSCTLYLTSVSEKHFKTLGHITFDHLNVCKSHHKMLSVSQVTCYNIHVGKFLYGWVDILFPVYHSIIFAQCIWWNIYIITQKAIYKYIVQLCDVWSIGLMHDTGVGICSFVVERQV